jgi:peptidyl-prolyl cis-trans isomerase C
MSDQVCPRSTASCWPTRRKRPAPRTCASAPAPSCCARRPCRPACSSAEDPAPLGGATTEAASTAIEALLDRELHLPEPTEEACRRHHAAHLARYAQGERALVRHVLFAVTPGVDVNALRSRAEACLLDLRCDGSATRFATVAGSTSNCPSGAEGGEPGLAHGAGLRTRICPRSAGPREIGVLPRLVATRFGLHVVEVLAREPGTPAAV